MNTPPRRPARPPPSGPTVPELTFRVIVLGLLLSVVMGAANVYLGLKAGMTVSASIPAAVVAMLILRALGGGSVLESNQVQTAASAGESLAAGIIFTMPALILVGAWERFDWLTTTLVAFTGGLLGILFMIPMRRVFVTGDANPELSYPEGVACAAVLTAGESDDASGSQAMVVVWGALIGGIFKAGIGFFGIVKGTLEAATTLFGSRILYFGANISPALFAVGFIVRLNVAVLIFIGGGLAWLVGIPLLGGGGAQVDSLSNAWDLWSTQVRYVGVGAMVVGGIASIWKVRNGLRRALEEIRGHGKSGPNQGGDLDRDLSSFTIKSLGTLAALLVGGIYYSLTHDIAISIATTVIMLIMSFFFSAVASHIVGLVGNSNSPVSGMTITAVLATGGLLYLFGFTGDAGIVATLVVAAIVCCAACTSGDVCNDLKTGQIVGASPRRQQIMQIVGVAVASLVMAPILQLLHANTDGGIGGRELPAPQAGLFASLADGFFGDGELPWDLVAVGAGVGVAFLILDSFLERAKAKFRTHLMPIAVGMYLPFGLATPILLGGVAAWAIGRHARGNTAKLRESATDARLQRGVLMSSGMIAGESLTGVGLALATSLGAGSLAALMTGGEPGAAGWALPITDATITVLTLAGAVAVMTTFWKVARPR